MTTEAQHPRETTPGQARQATPSDGNRPTGGARLGTERDFLYQRRLVSLRPFITDDGVPGLNLRFDGDETIAVRIEIPLLELFDRAISCLRDGLGQRAGSLSADAVRRR